MRRLSLSLIFTCLIISSRAEAQNATYACQFIAAGGLFWENGQWKTTKFKQKSPFFLNSVNQTLTNESVGKALGANPRGIFCHETFENQQSCGDWLGGALIFNFANLTGATSQIFGAAQKDNRPEKDSLLIQTFICTKM